MGHQGKGEKAEKKASGTGKTKRVLHLQDQVAYEGETWIVCGLPEDDDSHVIITDVAGVTKKTVPVADLEVAGVSPEQLAEQERQNPETD